MTIKRRRRIAGLSVPLFVVIGSVIGTGTAAATGSCKGNATEYVLDAEVRDATLVAYDVNGDGVICVAIHGKKTVYSDNRI